MQNETLHPLDYASPKTKAGGRPLFRAVLGACAVLGLLANLTLVYLSVQSVLRSDRAYHDLLRNPKAYGREIAPSTIASLGKPYALWVSNGLLVIASAFGLLLALHLLVLVWQIDRRPDAASPRLRQYRRWKPLGTAATAIAFFCAGTADFNFGVAATRHYPVGSGPPLLETIVLVAGALLPWWWIVKGGGARPAVG